MILNPYAVLALALSLLRLAVALPVVGLGVRAWRAGRVEFATDARTGQEDRNYLLYLLGLLVLGLGLGSWPLLYLLLQSYVPEWPGVMCVYGVTRVGTGSPGPSRFLPPLLQFLQLAKPALVFGGGVTSNLGASGVAERNLNRITVILGLVWVACIIVLGLIVKFTP